MVIGVLFFLILIAFQITESEYMTPKFGAGRDEQIKTITWAILFNLICFGFCLFAICKEKSEQSSVKVENEGIEFEAMSDDSN
mmetsp:Transcript_11009/g.12377  ORF Transcript_11009/g.12377 Transcript_11009/m.12377 type:complete len:83 (-) Transcript_11009:58-306(-)